MLNTDLNTNLDTVRDNASPEYQAAVMSAGSVGAEVVANQITSNPAFTNEFLNAVVNKICWQEIKTRRWNNKLKFLKGNKLPFGAVVEEIYNNPVIAEDYTYSSEDLLKVKKPDVKAMYYGVNYEKKFPVTISMTMVKRALSSQSEYDRFLNAIINSMYNGDEKEEFKTQKGLVDLAITNGQITVKQLDFKRSEMTKDNTETLVKNIKTDSQMMTFLGSDYNKYDSVKQTDERSLETYTPIENQVILVPVEIDTNMDVDVLAMAFNMSKKEFLARKVTVDNFTDKTVLGVLMDEAWFMCNDTLYMIANDYNCDNLSWKYVLHHHGIYKYSMLSNAVVYKAKAEA